MSRWRLVGLIAVSLVVLAACRQLFYLAPADDYELKAAAVAKTLAARAVIGERLVGPEYTEITTTLGPLAAKQLSQHADFAAVAVQLLGEAGVRKGDRVAVNLSGSFPALNIAVLAAITAIGAEPVITSSVGASTWGATDPDYTWPDIEKTLVAAGIWQWRSAAVSLGGVGDRGGGLTPEGVALAQAAAGRAGVPVLVPADLGEAIEKRLAVYGQSGDLPAALVNVGGNQVIFGAHGHRAPLRQALTAGYLPNFAVPDGLAAPFIASNRPVIHLLNVVQLAAAYGVKADSPPGTSEVMYKRTIPPAARVLIALWLGAAGWLLWYGGRKKEWWNGPCRY